MDSMNLLLSAPAILAIVQLLKAFGVIGKWAMLASIIVAIALYLAAYYLSSYGAWQAAAQGLLIGLAAAGVYDVAKLAGGKE